MSMASINTLSSLLAGMLKLYCNILAMYLCHSALFKIRCGFPVFTTAFPVNQSVVTFVPYCYVSVLRLLLHIERVFHTVESVITNHPSMRVIARSLRALNAYFTVTIPSLVHSNLFGHMCRCL